MKYPRWSFAVLGFDDDRFHSLPFADQPVRSSALRQPSGVRQVIATLRRTRATSPIERGPPQVIYPRLKHVVRLKISKQAFLVNFTAAK